MKPTANSLQPTVRFRLPPTVCFRPQSTVYGLRSASAFTLVELMVVVAIISILLMLLIPNIRTVREKAWSSHCQNNLRQYGIAMNHYMADYNGYFIYPGVGVGGAVDGSALSGANIGAFAIYDKRPVLGATVGGSACDYWDNFIRTYIGSDVTLASLSAGEPAIQVCPVVLKELHAANYFDPGPETSPNPNFKGCCHSIDPYSLAPRDAGDFESIYGDGYDDAGNLLPDYTSKYLDSAFTTYAINPSKLYQPSSNCPANVIAFIDWNAKQGWWATLNYTTWQFSNPTNNIVQDTPKWTNAWWLTEVGFHHLGAGNEYGANFVAMDGHVGWISSNAISITNFTTGL